MSGITATITRNGRGVAVRFYGLSARREGSAMGPQKRGIIATHGVTVESDEQAVAAVTRAREALGMLGIPEGEGT